MSFNQLKAKLKNELKLLSLDEYELNAWIILILEDIFQDKYSNIIIKNNLEINSAANSQIDNIIEQLKNKKPIQYVLGYAYFGELKVIINEHVLIPRSDTLVLVDTINKIIKQKYLNKLNILEIGIGSSAVSLSILMKNLNTEITGLDINKYAIEISSKNAQIYNLENRLKLINQSMEDYFENNNTNFDIIISNPPYISAEEYNKLPEMIRLYEPRSALVGYDNDGLGFYRYIAQLKNHLNQNGMIAVELENNCSREIFDIFYNNAWNNIELIKDFNDLDRVLIAFK